MEELKSRFSVLFFGKMLTFPVMNLKVTFTHLLKPMSNLRVFGSLEQNHYKVFLS